MSELVVATGHDLDVIAANGELVQLEAPRKNGAFDYDRIVLAAERRPFCGKVHVELADGTRAAVPVYEVTYTGLDNEDAMRRLVGGMAADQLLVVSRIGGRYLQQSDMSVESTFGHPACLVREPPLYRPSAANCIGIPQRTNYSGARDLRALEPRSDRWHDKTFKLVSLFLEEMRLRLPDDREVVLPRPDNPADVNYDYEPIDRTESGIAIVASRPRDIANLPAVLDEQYIYLVHSEVLIEALRLGVVSPREASRMFIAAGTVRDKTNRQTNTFTSLAIFSVGTLQQIYNKIRI